MKTVKTHPAIGQEDHLRTRLVLFLGFRTAEQAQDIGHNNRCVAVRLDTLFLFLPVDDISNSEY